MHSHGVFAIYPRIPEAVKLESMEAEKSVLGICKSLMTGSDARDFCRARFCRRDLDATSSSDAAVQILSCEN